MTVGVLTLELFLGGNQSLKEKRMVLKSLKDRLHHRFNVAVAEVDAHDAWQRAVLGVAAVGADRRQVNSQLSHIVDWIQADRSVDMVDYALELL